MNAQLLGFFSGFPTHHFPDDIVERLKEELIVREKSIPELSEHLTYGVLYS